MKTTPLHVAILRGNKKLVELLLKYKADPNIILEDGTTPLYKAIELENVKIVELLLKNGANPNVIVNEEYPIHLAVKKNNEKILRILLKHGANDKVLDKNNNTPRDIAKKGSEVYNILFAKEIRRKKIKRAIIVGIITVIISSSGFIFYKYKVVSEKLKRGNIPTGKIEDFLASYLINKSILYKAIRNNNFKLVKYLISKKHLKPEQKTLENAVKSGNLELVKYLISKGIKPNSDTLQLAKGKVKNYFKNVYFSKLKQQCDSNNIESCYVLGKIYTYGIIGIDKNYNKAKKIFKKIIKLNKNRADAWNQLGLIYYKEGIKNIAKKYFKIACDKKNASGCNNLGFMYNESANYWSAIKVLEKAVKLDPNDDKAWHNLSFAYYKLGYHNKTIKYLEKGCALGNENSCMSLINIRGY